MTYLLDVNVLIALLDPLHIHHDTAYRWFAEFGRRSWATSPIVQNGVIRIVGGVGYTNVPLNCSDVADALTEWCRAPGHQFWAEDISLLDAGLDERRSLPPKRVTDIYLLALCISKGGKLATLDRKIPTDLVRGGVEALHVIG